MGKSTINGHFPWQNVSSPEGIPVDPIPDAMLVHQRVVFMNVLFVLTCNYYVPIGLDLLYSMHCETIIVHIVKPYIHA